MSLLKSAEFIADVERQFEWYAIQANWEVAEKYIQGVESTCRLLERHPLLGPLAGIAHPPPVRMAFSFSLPPFSEARSVL